MFPLDTICNHLWLPDLNTKFDTVPSAGCRFVVMLVLTGEKCTQPSSNFVADLPPELQTIQTELEASIHQKEEEIANLSAELHHLNFTVSTPIAASMVDQVQPANAFQAGFHFTPTSVQDQPHLGHMVSGHMPTVLTSLSSYLQSGATTLASFSAPGSSSLSIPAGNSTSWASFPPHFRLIVLQVYLPHLHHVVQFHWPHFHSCTAQGQTQPFLMFLSAAQPLLPRFQWQMLQAGQPQFQAEHQVAQETLYLCQTLQGFFPLRFVCLSLLDFHAPIPRNQPQFQCHSNNATTSPLLSLCQLHPVPSQLLSLLLFSPPIQ